MIVDALLGQGLGEGAFLVAVLLDLGSLVLEPDLELRLGEPQLAAEVLPPLLCQVLADGELPGQSLQLLRVEGRPLLLLCAVLSGFHLPLALLPVSAS